jgi:hypothetical protein
MHLVNAQELTRLIWPLVFRLINIIDGIPIPMSALLVPSLPEGSGTFSVANWNIRSGRGAGLAAAAKRLRQMGVSCMVLTETKLTNDRYPRFVQGYHVIVSRAMSLQQGGIALLWRELENLGFLVEAVSIISPNVLTFQLVMGGV